MKKICSLTLAILVLTVNAFANFATVNSSVEYIGVRLTPEIYRNSNADLTDLVLKNANDEIVPFYVDSYQSSWAYSSKTVSLTPLDVFFHDDNYYIDLGLDGIYADTNVTSMVFESNSSDYLKNITIYGSYDSISWQNLQNSTIGMQNGTVYTETLFEKLQDFNFYRVKVENDKDFVDFTNIYLKYESSAAEKMWYTKNISIPFDVQNGDDISNVDIKNTYNLIMDKIQINSGETYRKTVQIGYISAGIESQEINGYQYSNNIIEMQAMQNTSLDFDIIIHNDDGNSMKIDEIIVTYFIDFIVFKNDNLGPYTLEFKGENENTNEFDTQEIENAINQKSVEYVDFDEISIKNDIIPQKKDNYMVFLYLGIGVVSGMFSAIYLAKNKEK